MGHPPVAAGIVPRQPDRHMVPAVGEQHGGSHAELSMESALQLATRPTLLVEGGSPGRPGRAFSHVSRTAAVSATTLTCPTSNSDISRSARVARLPRG